MSFAKGPTPAALLPGPDTSLHGRASSSQGECFQHGLHARSRSWRTPTLLLTMCASVCIAVCESSLMRTLQRHQQAGNLMGDKHI
eukprot:365469-Chlamydomonas_euryale.AAC.29